MGGVELTATIGVMSASLVYLLLRQILQLLTQLARDGGAKDVELLVTRWQCCAGRYTARSFSRPIEWCWRHCRGYSPATAGHRSLSPRLP